MKCLRRFPNSIAKHKATKIFYPYGACSSENNIILLPSPEKTCRNRSTTDLNDFTENSVVCLDKRNSIHLTAKINWTRQFLTWQGSAHYSYLHCSDVVILENFHFMEWTWTYILFGLGWSCFWKAQLKRCNYFLVWLRVMFNWKQARGKQACESIKGSE